MVRPLPSQEIGGKDGKKESVGSLNNVYMGHNQPKFDAKCLGESDIGENIRCRFYLVPTRCCQETSSDSSSSSTFDSTNNNILIICFNWMNPQSLWQRTTLSYSLLIRDTRVSPIVPIQQYFVNKAEKLYAHPLSRRILRDCGWCVKEEGEEGTGDDSNEIRMTHNDRTNGFPCKVVLAGFSQGGAIGHAFAYFLLREIVAMTQCTSADVSNQVCVIGFGTPRFSTGAFMRWYTANLLEGRLASESMNIILSTTVDETDENNNGTSLTTQDGSGKNGGKKKVLYIDPVACDDKGSTVTMEAADAGSTGNLETMTTTTDDRANDSITSTTPTSSTTPTGSTTPTSVTTCTLWEVPPNCYLLEGGLLRRATASDMRRMEELATLTRVSKTTVIWNALTRLSPHSEVFDKLYEQLHSVVKYYEELTM